MMVMMMPSSRRPLSRGRRNAAAAAATKLVIKLLSGSERDGPTDVAFGPLAARAPIPSFDARRPLVLCPDPEFWTDVPVSQSPSEADEGKALSALKWIKSVRNGNLIDVR